MSVRVAVWWDLDSCPIPKGLNVLGVSEPITKALCSNGIKGPMTINAFGNIAAIPRSTQKAISAGVYLMHVPPSVSITFFVTTHLINWVSQNPPPMHFFLISSNEHFARTLHLLSMRNYNVLLASSDCASNVLRSSATIMWPWNGLIRGEDVAVKHFNRPFGPWYGHYKGVLDDIDSQPRPIPKVLRRSRRKVVESVDERTPKPVMVKMDSNGDKEWASTKTTKPSSPTTEPVISPSFMPKESDVATSAASISTRRDATDPQPTPMNADANLKDTLSLQQKPDNAGEGLFGKVWRALSGTKAESQ